MYAHATGLAKASERWYADNRPVKRVAGRTLRVVALVLGGVAAVLPILSQIFTSPDGRPEIA